MSYNNGPIETLRTQKNYTIYFTHVPTDTAVSFPAWLTDFKDNYSSQWTTENVFGRYDPIYTFAQTTRNISFGFDVLAVDEKEAEKNLADLRLLTRMLYPTYANDGYATTILKAPLMRIKFSNLIGRGADGNGKALLGKINGFNIAPNNDMSYFDPGTKLYAKVFAATIQFDVLHEESPGFPYSNAMLQRPVGDEYLKEVYTVTTEKDVRDLAEKSGFSEAEVLSTLSISDSEREALASELGINLNQ